jgi:hypothetical protein
MIAVAYFDSGGDTYTFTPSLTKLNSTAYSFRICAYRTSSSNWNINLMGTKHFAMLQQVRRTLAFQNKTRLIDA